MINNRNYLIGNTFDNLNNDINKIDIDKFTKNEYEILEQLSKEQIIKISEENSKNKKENENNNIKIEEINYDLLYKLIKNINDECEKLKQIKEEKLQNSFDNEKNKNDSFNSYSNIILQNEKITKENIDLLNEINTHKKENMEILQRYSEDLYILQNMVNYINSSTI
jgi:thiamine pyrophosphate-dependent acetolactate synthase large subunit-like protein